VYRRKVFSNPMQPKTPATLTIVNARKKRPVALGPKRLAMSTFNKKESPTPTIFKDNAKKAPLAKFWIFFSLKSGRL